MRRTFARLIGPIVGGSWRTIFDNVTGAWSADSTISQDTILRQATVFRCITLIADDCGKIPLNLMSRHETGVWLPQPGSPRAKLLQKPNEFQTRLQFIKYWLCSLLLDGNTYVLLRRDGTGRIRRMTVLDPTLVTPMVSEQGNIYYRITGVADRLQRIEGVDMIVSAADIIHDTYITFNHPLLGCAPLLAAANAGMASIKANEHTRYLFTNHAMPGGILEVAEGLTDEQFATLKARWETYQGEDYGKPIVLENGVKFTPLTMKSVDTQLLEFLGFSREEICIALGVPPWKIGAGPMPSAPNAEVQQRNYYSQTLQIRLEAIEALLDAAFTLNPAQYRTEFDVRRGLFRMDALTQAKIDDLEMKAASLAPNEARAERNRLPVEGGDSPYLQQQNFSLAALAKRDAQEDPFASASAAPAEGQPADGEEEELPEDLQQAVDNGEMTEEEARDEAAERAFMEGWTHGD